MCSKKRNHPPGKPGAFADASTDCISQGYDRGPIALIFHLALPSSRLFDEINRGFSERDWTRYRQLIEKRRAEQLTAEEHVELTALSDRLERLNVRRLELLIELAKLRNTTLPALMDQLGLQPAPVA